MPQNDAVNKNRVPSDKAEELFRCAWTAYRRQLTPLALLGMGMGILNVMIYLLPAVPRIAAEFCTVPGAGAGLPPCLP